MNKNPYPQYNVHSLLGKAKNYAGRCLMLLIGCTIFTEARSQTDKRLELADKYYASGDYYTAAHLYGQFLNPVAKTKSTSNFPLNSKRNSGGRTGNYETAMDIKFRQAESYRLANYWKEAANLYKECFKSDSAKYASAFFWYAVSQRSTGNYAGAEETLNFFLNNYAAGNIYQQAAKKELISIKFIRDQVSKPDTILYHVTKLNAALENNNGVFAPVVLNNQLMVTSAQKDSVSEGLNPFRNRLFTTQLSNGSFQNILPVAIEGIDSSFNQGAASISVDGNHLYLTQWKTQDGKVVSSVYHSRKTINGWSQPMIMPWVNKSGSSSKQPFCSADGKYLFFASDRTGGQGGFDIWYVPLNSDGTTGEAVNAGSSVNSSENELAPFYHSSSNILVFASDRSPGMGGYDLYSSTRHGTTWKTPENMGYPVNSSRDDVYFFSSGKSLFENAYFSSDRGSECCLSIYTVSKTPKTKMITGVVIDCENNEPVADANVIWTDALGKAMHAITGPDGKYSFALTTTPGGRFSVSKDKYNAKTEDARVEWVNETNWRTDTLYNSDLCLDKKKLIIKVENVVTVYFDFDQSKLKERGIAQLDSIYNVLKEDTTATIQISGYTDGLGSVEYNKKLSDRRARACADYLIEKGLPAEKISFESFGACCPIEMELINGRDNPDGRSMNRRALINVNKLEKEQ